MVGCLLAALPTVRCRGAVGGGGDTEQSGLVLPAASPRSALPPLPLPAGAGARPQRSRGRTAPCGPAGPRLGAAPGRSAADRDPPRSARPGGAPARGLALQARSGGRPSRPPVPVLGAQGAVQRGCAGGARCPAGSVARLGPGSLRCLRRGSAAPPSPPQPRWRRPSNGVSPPTLDGRRGRTKSGREGAAAQPITAAAARSGPAHPAGARGGAGRGRAGPERARRGGARVGPRAGRGGSARAPSGGGAAAAAAPQGGEGPSAPGKSRISALFLLEKLQ